LRKKWAFFISWSTGGRETNKRIDGGGKIRRKPRRKGKFQRKRGRRKKKLIARKKK